MVLKQTTAGSALKHCPPIFHLPYNFPHRPQQTRPFVQQQQTEQSKLRAWSVNDARSLPCTLRAGLNMGEFFIGRTFPAGEDVFAPGGHDFFVKRDIRFVDGHGAPGRIRQAAWCAAVERLTNSGKQTFTPKDSGRGHYREHGQPTAHTRQNLIRVNNLLNTRNSPALIVGCNTTPNPDGGTMPQQGQQNSSCVVVGLYRSGIRRICGLMHAQTVKPIDTDTRNIADCVGLRLRSVSTAAKKGNKR